MKKRNAETTQQERTTAEKIWWLKHMEMRATQFYGAIEVWRRAMKRAGTPEACDRAADVYRRLTDYADRCEEEIADLYEELRKLGEVE